MWLTTIGIINFRGIDNLTVPLGNRANVIVDPNAIGKTTLLEAMRLAKASLAPRTLDETQQVFISLGAISPHNPTRLAYGHSFSRR
ncbi:MAG: AAA family ATPase [Enhydrobacter sp.]|nr:MAG: AAA family ATPase [Enhydrobacter sp.]